MSWDGPAWRRRERREAKRRFVRAGWGDKKGMFGKVVLASPAQHPARGQPEPRGNGSPLLVWCTDHVWGAPGSPASIPTATNCPDRVLFGGRPGWTTSSIIHISHIDEQMNYHN